MAGISSLNIRSTLQKLLSALPEGYDVAKELIKEVLAELDSGSPTHLRKQLERIKEILSPHERKLPSPVGDLLVSLDNAIQGLKNLGY